MFDILGLGDGLCSELFLGWTKRGLSKIGIENVGNDIGSPTDLGRGNSLSD